MGTSFLPAQLDRFRREAKKLSRELSIPHSEALDRIAVQHGFANWSLLVKHSNLAQLPHSAKPEPTPGVRHYVHGDIRESDPSQCYCVRCDAFEFISHLVPVGAHSDGKDGERFFQSLARWDQRKLDHSSKWYRPDDAQNVLAAAAVAERVAREAARSPFHRWLDGQRDRNDPVGDLAGDILRDVDFPIRLATRKELEDHLGRYGSHITKAFRQAWREFSGAKRQGWTLVD